MGGVLKIAGLEVVVQAAGEIVVGGVDEVHVLDFFSKVHPCHFFSEKNQHHEDYLLKIQDDCILKEEIYQDDVPCFS